MITGANNRFDSFYLYPLLEKSNWPRSNRLRCKRDMMYLMRGLTTWVSAYYSELYDPAMWGYDGGE